jgi:hypothetical protein
MKSWFTAAVSLFLPAPKERNPITPVFPQIIILFLLAASATVTPWFTQTALAVEAGPGQGLVIFHRRDTVKGKAVRFNMAQDGVPIGQLLAGVTIKRSLPPGNYVFSVSAPSLDGQDHISITVEAGRTYNVEGEILWGWPVGRPKFRMVSETVSAPIPGNPTVSSPAPTGALAGAALGSAVAPLPSRPGSVEMGRVGLRNFVGDWQLQMWSLAEDGSKLEGHGSATGSAEGVDGTRIMITGFESAAFPAASGGGQVLLSYEASKGFLLVSHFRHSDEVLRFSGQYQADTGKYVFYMFGGAGSTFATGVQRASARVEIRSLDTSSWVAETYSYVDGRMTRVQSYRFTRARP